MMDGARARRLKCGTPIGRIIDEAGDLMIYSWFGFYVGYILKAEPGPLCSSYALINMGTFSIEMTYIITGKFDQHAGEFDLGPVEIEVIATFVFWLTGYYGY